MLVFCCLLLLLGQCWQHAIHLVDGSVQAKPFLPIARSTQQEYGVMITLCKQVSPELVQQLQQKYSMALHHFIPENSFYVVLPGAIIAKLQQDDAICAIQTMPQATKKFASRRSASAASQIHALLDSMRLEECHELAKKVTSKVATNYRCASPRMLIFESNSSMVQELIDELANNARVLSIETPLPVERHSLEEKWVIQSNQMDFVPFTSAGLTGANQVIGVTDDGLNVNNCFFYDSTTSVQYTESRTELATNTKHRKVLLYYAYIDDVPNRHGTHTSGSAAGAASDRFSDANRINSMANETKLIFMDVGCDKSFCDCKDDTCTAPRAPLGALNLPLDVNQHLLSVLDKAGAKITSHSYGSPEQQYMFPSQSLLVDEFLNKNEDNIALYSAGNYGKGGMHTLGPFAAAKNGLTVGNSYNSRRVWNDAFTVKEMKQYLKPETLPPRIRANQTLVNETMQAGHCCFLYSNPCEMDPLLGFDINQRYTELLQAQLNVAFSFVKDSVNSALMVSCCPTCAIKALERAFGTSFDFNTSISDSSSIGPTVDGRIKPDVLVPGSLIMSANFATNYSCDASAYVALTGTSMATPTMASAVALVRQYFMDGYYPSGSKNESSTLVPSGALLKAVVIHSARLMQNYSGFIFFNPLAISFERFRFVRMNDLGYVWTRGLQGHGLVNLKNALPLQQYDMFNLFVHDRVVMPTITSNHTYGYITTNPCTIVVTLVWADVPGSPLASKMLVNDLDLTVRILKPESVYMGNYDPLFPLINEVDSVNNVEKIIVPNVPANTQVRIHVTSKKLISQQKYALVVTGHLRSEIVETIASPFNWGLILGISIPAGALVLFITASSICLFAYCIANGCKRKEAQSITDLLLEKELNP